MRFIWTQGTVGIHYHPSTMGSIDSKVRLGWISNPDDLIDVEERIGWIRQGRQYFENCKAVYHVKMEGTISSSNFYGIPSIQDQNLTILIAPGNAEYQLSARQVIYIEYINTPYGCCLWHFVRNNDLEVLFSPTGYMFWFDKSRNKSGHGRIDSPRQNFRVDEAKEWFRDYVTRTYSTGFSTTPRSTSGSLDQPDIGRIRRHCWRLTKMTAIEPNDQAERDLYWSVLRGQKDFDGNMINFVTKATSLGATARAALALGSNPKDPKAWASAWLSLRFSDRLMLKNAKQISDGLIKDLRELECGHQVSHSSVTFSAKPIYKALDTAVCSSRARLICSNKSYTDLMSGVKKLYEWDSYPTLENAWDLIPFSFVVDWFLSIGNILDDIDLMVYEQYLKVEAYERSDKIDYIVDPILFEQATGFRISYGQLHLISYKRYNGQIPNNLTPYDHWEPSLPSPTNVVDMTALAMQLFT